MTNRQNDTNGWVEIKDNPITRVGVFPYSGWQISDELPPNEIFMVYRPAEELKNPETIDSFRLLPWIEDHTFLGDMEGATPAEEVGMQGVVGEDIYFDENDGMLKANIKVFSSRMQDLIDTGVKKELSIGYLCDYIPQTGQFEGQNYSFVQKNMRGNHLASVVEGRAGKEVAVLDNLKLTFDSLELNKMTKKTKDEGEDLSLEDLAKRLDELRSLIEQLAAVKKDDSNTDVDVPTDDDDTDTDTDTDAGKSDLSLEDLYNQLAQLKALVEKFMDSNDGDTDVDTTDEDNDDKKKDDDDMKDKVKAVADSVENLKRDGFKSMLKQMRARDTLANQLSYQIGTFDHSDKTFEEVVQYGVKALGITCKKGHEETAVRAYLAAVGSPNNRSAAVDSAKASRSSQIDAYLRGGE